MPMEGNVSLTQMLAGGDAGIFPIAKQPGLSKNRYILTVANSASTFTSISCLKLAPYIATNPHSQPKELKPREFCHMYKHGASEPSVGV